MDIDLIMDEIDEPNPALNRITNAILGTAFEVHTALSCGFQEAIYQKALAIEFRLRGIKFVSQARFPVLYKGQVVGEGIVDFLIEDSVIVELKAVEALNSLFTAQVISYLKASNNRLGLLINFNVRRLKDGIKRIAY